MLRILIFLLLLANAASAFATQTLRGSADEARALAERAAAYIDSLDDDVQRALDSMTAPNMAFVDRDLYVFVVDANGRLLANGANSKVVGRDMIWLKDLDGQPFVRKAIETALRERAGWTPRYRFTDPLTHKIITQQSYVILVDGIIVGVGFQPQS